MDLPPALRKVRIKCEGSLSLNQVARQALQRSASLTAVTWRHAEGSYAVKPHLLSGRAGQGGARQCAPACVT
ncbi:hypothetical protein C9397_20825 [Xanthomonas vasicola pv. vasculorum]|uniref:Uncharacterized protein n=1 Tax=Xanthomonas vasicola pv. vasculorum TaxID=325776 RepID=A0AAE8JWD7_XANVA|nr:hypothetical protein C7V42_04215 [Xanthomonas vasicola pv. vasculorum]AZR27927.1 hypothetical protein NX80_017315 [Xanthomonas vasicola pv. arecae]AZR29852.1 hypothetical protein KWO_004150 [Xanthomonas vasicola pv. musacearum NCPPB 4379]AZR33775.1 hypothetical protein NX08_004040 [Xanthomonas vasicola]KFA23047.1 hypothetical protein KWU_0108605 [Xanthomonas vasicola pv. musacearum NCPPB 4394]RRJ43610.1 hypothetical protein EIM46_03900 [Xanthomonas vasicola pv. musacearum]